MELGSSQLDVTPILLAQAKVLTQSKIKTDRYYVHTNWYRRLSH